MVRIFLYLLVSIYLVKKIIVSGNIWAKIQFRVNIINMRTLLSLILALGISACDSNETKVNNVAHIPPPSNNIRSYLTNTAHDITKNSLKDIQSVADWEEIKSSKYQEFVEMISLGDMPLSGNRSPLNVKITGTIQMDGYRIEKLYYESLPGLYVPANLYIPDNIKEPTAAVLYLCGHTRTQKVSYQTHPQKFAKLGFVCLIPETIQYGEVQGEHWGCYANGWFNWYSKGYTPAGVEVWNAIRGLDLLSQRPEVDKSNLGATGISGGGAISWFLGAIDPRVKAVAPVCGASTLEAQVTTRTMDGHCDCINYINTYGWDFTDVGALIAPRALLIGQADRDGLNKVESVREIYQDVKSFYELMGAPDNVSYIETPGGHSYHKDSREGIFSFFLNHLKNSDVKPHEAGDIDESPDALLSVEDLAAYTQGAPADDITTIIQDSFIELPTPPNINSIAELSIYRDTVKQFLLDRTFHNFPDSASDLNPELVFRTDDYAAYGYERYHITTEQGWRLTSDIYWRHPKNEKRPMMVILRNADEHKEESEVNSYQLNDEWNVTIVDVRGIGESGWAPNLQWHVRRASAWTGRTVASMRVYDLLRFLEFSRSLPGVDPDQVGILASGEMSVVALYTALLDGNCKTVIVKDPPASQNVGSRKDGRGAAIEMLNCLRITDVNQMPALIHPTATVMVGEIPESYTWAINSLKNIDQSNLLLSIEELEQYE